MALAIENQAGSSVLNNRVLEIIYYRRFDTYFSWISRLHAHIDRAGFVL